MINDNSEDKKAMSKIVSENGACQGDMRIRPVSSIPSHLKAVEPTKDGYVVAHSETGHHHVVQAIPGVRMYPNADDATGLSDYIEVDCDGPVDVVHMRPWDTHETLSLLRGTYIVKRQREATVDGWARVED